MKFLGCHAKASVKMAPTTKCLVALVESPFFVLDVDEVEICYLERVEYSLKNFDFVMVYKDYTTFKRINSVPMESLESIKAWLDSVNILYFEGRHPMNWATVLSTIREDVNGFIEDGGWKFLNQDEDESENE